MSINITSVEFVKIWTGHYRGNINYQQYYRNNNGVSEVIFNDFTVSEDIICSSQGPLPSLILNRCNAKNLVFFNCKIASIQIHSSRIGFISFENVENGNLLISGASAGKFIRFNKSSKNKNIEVFSSSLESIDITDNTTIENIFIKESSKIGGIQLKNSNGKSLIITNSTVNSIRIEDQSESNEIQISNSQTESIDINNAMTKNIRISDNSIGNRFLISNSKTGSVTFQTNSKQFTFTVNNNSITGYINIQGGSALEFFGLHSSVIGSISSYKSTISYLSIEGASFVFGVTLEYLSESSKQLLIGNSTVEQILLALDKPYHIKTSDNSQIHTLRFEHLILTKETVIQISDTKINELNMQSFLNQGTVVFNNIAPLNKFRKIKTINNVPKREPNGNYEFEEIEKLSEIKVVNSDLGKTQFIGCNLQAFDAFLFLNSKLLDIFVADSQFPTKSKILSVPVGCKENKIQERHLLNQQRLALSQFKKVYENQGDIVKAMDYHASELETYRELLKKSNPKTFKDRCNKVGELFNLWLNRYSSYYGNNWLRAVILTVLLNSILFACYCWALGFKLGTNSSLFWKLASYSFEFLNPLRKADFLSSLATPTNEARVIDYLSRIIIAYFVYQTIQAFRKYGKKAS